MARVATADDMGHQEFQRLYLEHLRGNQPELNAVSAYIAEHGVARYGDT